MARSSEAKAAIEVERMAILHAEQVKLRRRLNKEVKVKKKNPHLPGEEMLKKNTAVLLKIGVPNISYNEIADRIGETRKTVKDWFKTDVDVKDFYDWALNNLKEGSLELMKTYSLEAVETLVVLMRFGSEKYMFEAAREILDRVGVPKVNRTEIERTDTTDHRWGDKDQLVAQIRALPIERQEEAIEAMEKFEELLAQNSVPNEVVATNGHVDLNDDTTTLPALSRSEDEEEEDEDED